MDLAADLGLDRGQVLAWIQDFAALSEEQRTAALAPLGPAIAAAKQQAAAATEAAQRAAQAERQRAAAAALAAGEAMLQRLALFCCSRTWAPMVAVMHQDDKLLCC